MDASGLISAVGSYGRCLHAVVRARANRTLGPLCDHGREEQNLLHPVYECLNDAFGLPKSENLEHHDDDHDGPDDGQDACSTPHIASTHNVVGATRRW